MKIHPRGQYVIKTKTLRAFHGVESGCKLFINVCYDDEIPVGEIPASERGSALPPLEEIFELIREEDWSPRIVVSPWRKCPGGGVFDAVLNSLFVKWTMVSEEWRNVLTLLIFNAIEGGMDELIDGDVVKYPRRVSIDDPLDFDCLEKAHEQEEEVGIDPPVVVGKPTKAITEREKPIEPLNQAVLVDISEDSTIVAKETKRKKGVPTVGTAITAELTTLERSATVGGYSQLLRVTSQKDEKFTVKYHQETRELCVNSQWNYPLSLTPGEFQCFHVGKTLYVYIK